MAKYMNGKTWKQHSAPYLKAALDKASASWKPKRKRESEAKRVKELQAKRVAINAEIKRMKNS